MKDRTFRFRLERVHGLRRQAERSAQEELAASLGRRRESERSLREIEATIEGARQAELSAGGGLPRSGGELSAANAYLERLAGNRVAAAQALSEREGEVEASRRGLLDAARERQALDRLRERRLAEHRREELRAEGERLDELALAVHRRGRAA